MLNDTKQELCYLTQDAFVVISHFQSMGVEDFDLALEMTRNVLGDSLVYNLEG